MGNLGCLLPNFCCQKLVHFVCLEIWNKFRGLLPPTGMVKCIQDGIILSAVWCSIVLVRSKISFLGGMHLLINKGARAKHLLHPLLEPSTAWT